MQVQIRVPKGRWGLLNSTAWLREPSFFSMQAFTGLDETHPHYVTIDFTVHGQPSEILMQGHSPM